MGASWITTHTPSRSPTKAGQGASVLSTERENSEKYTIQGQPTVEDTALSASPGTPQSPFPDWLGSQQVSTKFWSEGETSFLHLDLKNPVWHPAQPSGSSQAFLTWLLGDSFSELSILWSALFYFHSHFFPQLEMLPGVALPGKTWLIFSPWLDSNSYRG